MANLPTQTHMAQIINDVFLAVQAEEGHEERESIQEAALAEALGIATKLDARAEEREEACKEIKIFNGGR